MSLTNSPSFALTESLSLLAWARWQLHIPSDWRPLKINGTLDKGWMIIGDAVCAIFSVHWERPAKRAISDGDLWVQERLKKQGLLADPMPPAADRFTSCAWARGVQSQEDKQTTYWYGWSEPAKLLLGIKINGVLPESELGIATEQVLPSLRAFAADEPSHWAMHDVNFVVPAGFELAQRHLFAGDVALEFTKEDAQSLLLRQVYPGELAIKRRKLENWLKAYPFKEHRRLRSASVQVDPWKRIGRSELKGIRRRGCKRLGRPLGMVNPRNTNALAVYDQSLDRLLIAEHMALGEPDADVCEQAVLKMNQQLRERMRHEAA